MKKIRYLLMLAVLALIVGVIPVQEAHATDETFERDGIIYRVQGFYNTECYNIAGYTGELGTDVVIPEYIESDEYGKRPVFRVEKAAFKGNKTLRSITFESPMLRIGAEAFMDCTALESVTFATDPAQWIKDNTKESKTHLTLDDRAFANCTSLEYFEIPYGIDVPCGDDVLAGSGVKHLKFVMCGWTQNTPKVFNNCPELEVVDFECSAYEPGYSKRLDLCSMTGLPKLKEINVYGMDSTPTLGIDYSKYVSDPLLDEDIPALEYINVYVPEDKIGKTQFGVFFNADAETVSSNPDVVEITGSKTSGTYANVRSAGVAELSCTVAKYKIRVIAGDGEGEKKDLSTGKAVIPQEKITYNGKDITPYSVVTFEGAVLEEGKDYKVTFSDNKEVGTAKAVFTGTGEYKGELNAEFTIVPPVEAYLVKVSVSGKKYTLAWNKGEYADGYQVYYSKKKTGGYKKLYSGADSSASSAKLKSGMYIKIRSYKKAGGKVYYSDWTSAVQIE